VVDTDDSDDTDDADDTEGAATGRRRRHEIVLLTG